MTSHTRRHTPVGGAYGPVGPDCACVLQPSVKFCASRTALCAVRRVTPVGPGPAAWGAAPGATAPVIRLSPETEGVRGAADRGREDTPESAAAAPLAAAHRRRRTGARALSQRRVPYISQRRKYPSHSPAAAAGASPAGRPLWPRGPHGRCALLSDVRPDFREVGLGLARRMRWKEQWQQVCCL